MRLTVVFTTLLCVQSFLGLASGQVLLYDITFDSPLHTLNQPPTTEFGPPIRNTPSRIDLGNASDIEGEIVVESFLDMVRPVEMAVFDPILGSPSGGVQFICDLDDGELPEFEKYVFEFEIALDSYPGAVGEGSGGVGISIGAFGIAGIRLADAGTINLIDSGIPPVVIGSYECNQVINVQLIYDSSNSIWSANVDGMILHVGQFDGGQQEDFRIAETNSSPSIESRTYIDNLKVFGLVLGDIDGDGVANLNDVGPFVEQLLDGQFSLSSDFNLDGATDLLDVEFFVDAILE
ncbi:MAG: hypothetical protein AAGA30_07285 [Planctomycetota bacterium]